MMYCQRLFIGFLLAVLTGGTELGSRLTLGTSGVHGDGGIIKNCEAVVGEDDSKNLSRNPEHESMEGLVEDGSSTPSPSAEGGMPYSSVVTWSVVEKKNTSH